MEKIGAVKNYMQGENHHRAKLSNHEVELFRQLLDAGMTQYRAAIKFGISFSHASRLANYKQR